MSAPIPGRRAFGVALLLAIATGACTTRQALPTYSMRPDQGIGGELLVGTLVAGEGTPCVQVKQLGQPAIALVWPSEFTASTNPLRIYDARGSEVAAEADTVTVGGVFVDKWSLDCKTQGFFEVMQMERGGLEGTG